MARNPTSNRATGARAWVKDLTPPVLLRAARHGSRRLRPGPTTPNATKLPIEQRDEYGAEFYDEVYEAEDRWDLPYWKMQWYASWAVIVDRIMLTEDPKVLDMGCGPGHLGRMLADRGLTKFVGFDFSEKRLAAARGLVPELRFEVADAYTTDLFETVDYGIATCCEFLEHLDGDLAILDRLPTGTRVLGTVPNYDATAHLRFFSSEAEVMDRYAPKFTDLRVDRVHNTGKGIEFVLDGHRS